MEKNHIFKSPTLQPAAGSTETAARTALPPEPMVDSSVGTRPGEKIASGSSFLKALGGVSTWGFADQAIVSVTSFLAAACVGRVCGSVELGIYTLAVKIFWLAAGIPNALIWMPYTSRAPRMTVQRRRYFLGSTTAHLVLLMIAISLGLLLVGLAPLPGLSGKPWLLPMCVALVPFSILMLLREHLRRVLLAHLNTSGLLLVDVPIAVLQLSILGLLVWTDQLSAVTALVGMALGCSWSMLWLARNRDRFRVERRRIETHWGYNFQLGKWLLVVSVAWLLGDASFYWLVESFHGLTVMGQFSAAAITVMLFNPILLTVQNLARSVLSNSYAQGGQEILWNKTVQQTRLIAIGFGALFLVLVLCGGRMVTLFFGSEFTALDSVVATLCLGMYLYVLCVPVEAALTTLQDGRAMLVGSLLRLGLILLAGIPLIALYGPIGVGFAMAIGSLGAVILQWNLFLRRLQNAS